MNKEEILSALAQAKDISDKRNFKQTFDLIINLKGVDMKKTDQQVSTYVTFSHSKGKKAKICALVGPELEEHAKKTCDGTITASSFDKYTDKKEIKKLASQYDFFIAQANIMPRVATAFGRVLGPRGKMPNPKAGCVVPPNANLKPLYDRLQRTVKAMTRTSPLIQCGIGSEDMKLDDIAENALTFYNAVVHLLPNEKHNVKDVYVKLTMGKPVMVGEKLVVKKETK
jgi:large subunit ribosomal protein L1